MCAALRACTRMMRGRRRPLYTTGALSDGTPPDFDAGIRWQADRKKAMPRARSGAFWCHFRLGCSPSCPSSILIASSRPSRRVYRLQSRRSARRSSLSARLPGLPSRWPAYFLVRPRGTCTARAAVVGCCARPWGRITLQWRNGAPPGAFERRDVSVLGRPASVMRARRTACT